MKPVFVSLGAVCSLGAMVSSLWWSYGGESTHALVATLALWMGVGSFAFAGGYRGEIPSWDANASPFVRGLVAAFVGVAATFVGIVVVNFRTDAGEAAFMAVGATVSGGRRWEATVPKEIRGRWLTEGTSTR